MISNTDFYSAYLNNHFKIKSRIAAYFLNLNQDDISDFANKVDIGVNDIEFLKTIKIDLIQSFYQSVETLFGMMYSLETIESNLSITDYLVSAKIKDQHAYIASFENFDRAYKYLKSEIINKDKVIPKFQWLFYFLSVFAGNDSEGFIEKAFKEDNIKGIALTLKDIAQTFNKEAHNSIKHGLRCIMVDKLNYDIQFPEGIDSSLMPEEFKKFTVDGDALLYYTKGPKGDNVANTVIVPIDVRKIIYLEDGINKLLHNIINQRQMLFDDNRPNEFKVHYLSYSELIKIEFPSNANFQSLRMGSAK